MKMKVLSAAAPLLFAFAALSAHASLLGSSVVLNGACCSNTSNITSTLGPVTVGAGVEFPSIPLYLESVDVTANQIIVTTNSFEGPVPSYAPGGFNGYILTFTGAPTISSVLLDGASSLAPVGFSFTGNVVSINFAGESVVSGSRTILDVNTASTPEPSSFALLGTGVLGAAGAVRRRLRA